MFTFKEMHDVAKHGTFAPVCERYEEMGGKRIRATGPEGEYDAYRLPDGRIVGACLRVASAAKEAADAAFNTAISAEQTKRTAALTVVKNQVARVRAIAPASRTDQDRWLLALSYLVLREE